MLFRSAFTAKAGNEGASATAPSAGATTQTGAATSAGEPSATAGAVVVNDTGTTGEGGGMSGTLVITLVVLALVVVGALLYVFVFASKRPDE